VLRSGDELKLIYPQPGTEPDESAEGADFRHWWLQPMDGRRSPKTRSGPFSTACASALAAEPADAK